MIASEPASGKQTRDYVVLGIVGAVSFALAFALGTGLNLATGIPLTGGLVNAVITAAALTVGVCAVPRFGSGTILWLVFSVLAIPTVTLGPPGPHKVLVGLIGGLIWDILLRILPKRIWGWSLAAAGMTAAIMLATFGSLILFGLPGADKLKAALPFLLAIYLPLGALGGALGGWLYERKLARTSFFRR